MKIFKISILVIFSLLIFTACNSDGKKTNDKASDEMALNEIISAADAISPEINSINDVFSTLELAEAAYYPVLCNDPYNASNYLKSKPVAAANLGIYVTDIVYHTYGDANEDMFLAFSASQELARYIGLESEFAATLLTELEGGSISRDSLIQVFNGLMKDSEEYNSAEEMIHVHTAFLAGLYMEKLFIISSLLEQGQNKEDASEKDIVNFKKLFVVFENQLETLDVLKASIESQKKNLSDKFSVEAFAKLNAAAVDLKAKSEEILNSSKLMLTPELTSTYTLISEIRTHIVSES
jgi:hypothetical protein